MLMFPGALAIEFCAECCAFAHPDVDRGFLIRGGPEGRGTREVFRGAGPGRLRFHL